MNREFVTFTHREATIRVSARWRKAVEESVRKNRYLLEAYIAREPRFLHSLVPIPIGPDPPEVAVRMHRASLAVGVGPMAAVAGAVAQMAGEAALAAAVAGGGSIQQAAGSGAPAAGQAAAGQAAAGAGPAAADPGYGAPDSPEVIVENGGDIFLALKDPAVIGLWAGGSPLSGRIAFRILPEDTPLGVCSSSGTMGHSLSLGSCDLATVFSRDAALADAAATLAANMVKSESDIEAAVNEILAIPGIMGLIVVKGERIGMGGFAPELIRNRDTGTAGKVTRDPRANWVIE